MSLKHNESYRFYNNCYTIAGPVLKLFRPFIAHGAENMPEGAALICANHSAMIDPLQIALALKRDKHIHVFAKAELYKVPIISLFVQKLGAIRVDRNTLDLGAIKTALGYLRKGELVVIFPEGTRLSENDTNAAKSGAVKLAERTGVPIVPVYIPRRKPFFKRTTIVFGEPYYIEKQTQKRTPDDYAQLSTELMERIEELGETT